MGSLYEYWKLLNPQGKSSEDLTQYSILKEVLEQYIERVNKWMLFNNRKEWTIEDVLLNFEQVLRCEEFCYNGAMAEIPESKYFNSKMEREEMER